jgi:hypothetical protein
MSVNEKSGCGIAAAPAWSNAQTKSAKNDVLMATAVGNEPSEPPMRGANPAAYSSKLKIFRFSGKQPGPTRSKDAPHVTDSPENGITNFTPAFSKSATFLVTPVKP